jgi:uncharacterized protein
MLESDAGFCFQALGTQEIKKKRVTKMSSEKFKDLLDQSYQWPDYYEFKFIIRVEDKSLVLAKLEGFTINETPSKKGNYISISARKLMISTQEVIEVYEVISTIKGVISL